MTSPLNPNAASFNPNAPAFTPRLNVAAPEFVPNTNASPFIPAMSDVHPPAPVTKERIPIMSGYRRQVKDQALPFRPPSTTGTASESSGPPVSAPSQGGRIQPPGAGGSERLWSQQQQSVRYEQPQPPNRLDGGMPPQQQQSPPQQQQQRIPPQRYDSPPPPAPLPPPPQLQQQPLPPPPQQQQQQMPSRGLSMGSQMNDTPSGMRQPQWKPPVPASQRKPLGAPSPASLDGYNGPNNSNGMSAASGNSNSLSMSSTGNNNHINNHSGAGPSILPAPSSSSKMVAPAVVTPTSSEPASMKTTPASTCTGDGPSSASAFPVPRRETELPGRPPMIHHLRHNLHHHHHHHLQSLHKPGRLPGSDLAAKLPSPSPIQHSQQPLQQHPSSFPQQPPPLNDMSAPSIAPVASSYMAPQPLSPPPPPLPTLQQQQQAVLPPPQTHAQPLQQPPQLQQQQQQQQQDQPASENVDLRQYYPSPSNFLWEAPHKRLGSILRVISYRLRQLLKYQPTQAPQQSQLQQQQQPQPPQKKPLPQRGRGAGAGPSHIDPQQVLSATPYVPSNHKSPVPSGAPPNLPARIFSAPLTKPTVGGPSGSSSSGPMTMASLLNAKRGTNLPSAPPAANGERAAPSASNPLVVLIFGNRGAGKTTQAEAMAKRYNLRHLSSGTIFNDNKEPFEELRRVVIEEFGPNSVHTCNGLVLDRFIINSEIDAYYLQSALNEGNLPVPIVFWLQVPPNVGMERANSRGDEKGGNEHWRIVEQRAQAAVADLVYQPLGCLYAIDVETMGEREVGDKIMSTIDSVFPRRRKHINLPLHSAISGQDSMPIVENREVFVQLTKQVHTAIGNRTSRIDSAPLSSIAGYVDGSYFHFGHKAKRSLIASMHVTLKTDGTRFLIVKHKTYGFVGMPFRFNSCYDMNAAFAGMNFPDMSSTVHTGSSARITASPTIDVLLDVELAVESNGVVVHVIDYVYFYGKQAKNTAFTERYTALKQWFVKMKENSDNEVVDRGVVLKKYVPVRELGKLLPRFEDAPFEIDGVVFQHNETYRFGPDRRLLKWKPEHMCTADFRLMNLRQREDDMWECALYVCDSTAAAGPNSASEVPYANATGVFTDVEYHQYKLRNSMIVELGIQQIRKNPLRTTWAFHRLRTDKPHPNKSDVVKEIVELDHLDYPKLVELCSKC